MIDSIQTRILQTAWTGTLMDWENCLTLAAKTGDVVRILTLDNPALIYMVWHWQNLPGINNDKEYQGEQFATGGMYMVTLIM